MIGSANEIDEFAYVTGRFLAVHPTVTLSVVDHHQRIAKDSVKRVAGVLLGETEPGNTTHATNSFAVPFEEDAKDPNVWYFDHLYLENMAYMFSKINKRERIIGWYATGNRIKPADLAINELIRRYVPHPLYLLVNVSAGEDSSGEPPFRAYIAYDEPSTDKRFRTTFAHIPSGVSSVEAEAVGVEHLLRDLRAYTVSSRSQQLTDKLSALKCLEERLADFVAYLYEVNAGKMPINNRILMNLQNLLNLSNGIQGNLAAADDGGLVDAFVRDSEEGLFALYIGVVVRAVTAMHGLVRNRLATAKDVPSKKSTATVDVGK